MGYSTLYTNAELVVIITERDGNVCKYPGCNKEFTESNPATLDHRFPQSWCKLNGWTEEETHHINNLELMCKPCNSKKGDRLYDENGDLEQRRVAKLPKAQRPTVCVTCMSGRKLLPGQVCGICFSGAQPTTAPTMLKRSTAKCDHTKFHCWMCFIGLIPRRVAIREVVEDMERSYSGQLVDNS